MATSRRSFALEVEGARQVARALRDASEGGTDDMLKDSKRRVETIVVREGQVLVPKRSGRLGESIRGLAEESNGLWPTVAAGSKGTVDYAGPIHFGWPTRGLHRADQDTFDAVSAVVAQGGIQGFGTKSITKIRRRRASAAKGRGKALARGGPIAAQPFLYEAADHRQGEIYDAYERSLDQLARAVSN